MLRYADTREPSKLYYSSIWEGLRRLLAEIEEKRFSEELTANHFVHSCLRFQLEIAGGDYS